MNVSEGRVPVSWDECADWLEWFGRESVVWLDEFGQASPVTEEAEQNFRMRGDDDRQHHFYRLLPPSGLVAAPEGMDGGGWLGEGRHVPEGWEWRNWTSAPWRIGGNPAPHVVVQCRPPVRPRDVVEVPLTRLVGRTIEHCDVPVACDPFFYDGGWGWQAHIESHLRRFPDGSLDLDTGRVRVYAEGDEK